MPLTTLLVDCATASSSAGRIVGFVAAEYTASINPRSVSVVVRLNSSAIEEGVGGSAAVMRGLL